MRESGDEPTPPGDRTNLDDPRGRLLPRAVHERPLLFWSALLAVLAGLAAFLPERCTGFDDGLLEKRGELNAFSDRIAEVDARLAAGREVTLEASRARRVKLLVESRRVLRAGALSENDLAALETMLAKMHGQMARESRPASRRAVREMWLDRITERFPRLDRRKVDEELQRVHSQFDRHARRTDSDAG